MEQLSGKAIEEMGNRGIEKLRKSIVEGSSDQEVTY